MYQLCASSPDPYRYLHREPLSSALDALRSTPLYTHVEDAEDVTPIMAESRHLSPYYTHHIPNSTNAVDDLEACPTWLGREAPGARGACARLGDGLFGARWAVSRDMIDDYEPRWTKRLEKRLRIGSWVAVIVLLLLTICFMMREL